MLLFVPRTGAQGLDAGAKTVASGLQAKIDELMNGVDPRTPEDRARDGKSPLMNRAVTGGIMRYCADRGDLTGIGVSWEDPSDRALRQQKSMELFCKLQLAQNLAVTPSLQVLIDPALNPNDNTLTVFGIRGRITF